MKKIYTASLFVLFSSPVLFAQAPDWSTQIAHIIYSNCSSCHREGNIAPFPLMSYEDAVNNAYGLQTMVNAHLMPPWPPDPEFRHFANEAVLSQSDIDAINQWIDAGAPSGDLSQAPPPPVFTSNTSQLSSIDETIQIEPYTTQFPIDEYRYFVIPSGYTDIKYLNAIEVFPGDWSMVHHVDIYFDSTGHSADMDALDPLSGFNGDTGYPSLNYYVGGWSPGGNALKLPKDWGVRIPPGVDYVLEIHYAPGNQGKVDSTRVNFKYVTDTSVVRKVVVETPIYDFPPTLVNFPLKIQANEVKTFHEVSDAMPTDMSFIALSPHMHLIGRTYKVWFQTTDGDSVNLINIPDWNFHWQMYYQFQQIQKIPAGARIFGEAFYDNTINNPYNPNNPPITVKEGPYTTDEMLMTFMAYTEYQPGDEDIIMDSSMIATGVTDVATNDFAIDVYPNPANNYVIVNGNLPGEDVQMRLVNALGMVVQQLPSTKIPKGIFTKKISLASLPTGIYFLELTSADQHFSTSIVKSE
jgi:hypothetical protein